MHDGMMHGNEKEETGSHPLTPCMVVLHTCGRSRIGLHQIERSIGGRGMQM